MTLNTKYVNLGKRQIITEFSSNFVVYRFEQIVMYIEWIVKNKLREIMHKSISKPRKQMIQYVTFYNVKNNLNSASIEP